MEWDLLIGSLFVKIAIIQAFKDFPPSTMKHWPQSKPLGTVLLQIPIPDFRGVTLSLGQCKTRFKSDISMLYYSVDFFLWGTFIQLFAILLS